MKSFSLLAVLVFVSFSGLHAQESAIIKQLKIDGDGGDYYAARVLALAYAVGDGVGKDVKASDYWYSVAATHRPATTLAATPSGSSDHADDHAVVRNRSSSYFYPDRLRAGSSGQFNFGLPSIREAPACDFSTPLQKPAAETSTWKKVQDFFSEHTDEVGELATFLLEKYVPGLQSTEGTETKSGQSLHPSK